MSNGIKETTEQKIERLKAERFLLADALKQIQLILKANSSRFIEGIPPDALILAEKVYFTDYD